MRIRRPILCLLLICPLLSGKDYPIVLSRPRRAGERYHRTAETQEENRVTAVFTDRPMQTRENSTRLSLDADVEVLAVDKRLESKIRIRIGSIRFLRDGHEELLVPGPATLVAERKGGETHFTSAQGGELPDKVQAELRRVFDLSEDMNADDRSFGTDTPRSVGDTWPVRKDAIAGEARRHGLRVDPETLHGEARLEGLAQRQGQACLRIGIAVEARNLSGFPMPPGFQLTRTLAQIQVSALYPTDTRKRVLESTETTSFEFTGLGKLGDPGEEREVTLMGRWSLRQDYADTPLPEPQARQAPFPGGSQAPGARWLDPVSGIDFRWVPPGTFMMGSPEDEDARERNEGPRHEVELTEGFWMGACEVTQAQYQAVMGENPSHRQDPGRDLPVDGVSWEDAQACLARLNALNAAMDYRLPTEAEWEYACRSGTAGSRPGELDETAWYAADNAIAPHPVGLKQPNAWGLCDMLGNVWEWCQDDYGFYAPARAANPVGPASGSPRVLRGGSFATFSTHCRSAARDAFDPAGRSNDYGFRIVAVPRKP